MQSALHVAFRTTTFAAAAAVCAMLLHAPEARADDDAADSRIRQGFAIAPVPLGASSVEAPQWSPDGRFIAYHWIGSTRFTFGTNVSTSPWERGYCR